MAEAAAAETPFEPDFSQAPVPSSPQANANSQKPINSLFPTSSSNIKNTNLIPPSVNQTKNKKDIPSKKSSESKTSNSITEEDVELQKIETKGVSPGVGVLIDTDYLLSDKAIHRNNPYYILIGKTRFYGSSPENVVQSVRENKTLRSVAKLAGASSVIQRRQQQSALGVGEDNKDIPKKSIGNRLRNTTQKMRNTTAATGKKIGTAFSSLGKTVGKMGSSLKQSIRRSRNRKPLLSANQKSSSPQPQKPSPNQPTIAENVTALKAGETLANIQTKNAAPAAPK